MMHTHNAFVKFVASDWSFSYHHSSGERGDELTVSLNKAKGNLICKIF